MTSVDVSNPANSADYQPRSLTFARESLIESVRQFCLSKGLCGIKGLAVVFRRMDKDFSRHLSYAEFSLAMHEYGVGLSEDETQALFDTMDKDANNVIDFAEFLEELRPPMSDFRLAVVKEAFESLDENGDDVLEVEDLFGRFKEHACTHPRYQSGEWTAEEVISNFLCTFDSDESPDGIITKEEFLDYYAAVSSTIADDGFFDLMMRRSWNLPSPGGRKSLPRTNNAVQNKKETPNTVGTQKGKPVSSQAQKNHVILSSTVMGRGKSISVGQTGTESVKKPSTSTQAAKASTSNREQSKVGTRRTQVESETRTAAPGRPEFHKPCPPVSISDSAETDPLSDSVFGVPKFRNLSLRQTVSVDANSEFVADAPTTKTRGTREKTSTSSAPELSPTKESAAKSAGDTSESKNTAKKTVKRNASKPLLLPASPSVAKSKAIGEKSTSTPVAAPALHSPGVPQKTVGVYSKKRSQPVKHYSTS